MTKPNDMNLPALRGRVSSLRGKDFIAPLASIRRSRGGFTPTLTGGVLSAQQIKIGVISTYPMQGEKHAKIGAVAAYTKDLVTSLPDKNGIRIYANRLDGKSAVYEEDGLSVVRCWDKGGLYVFQIFRHLRKDRPKIVHIHHEFFLYGGIVSALAFPVMLFLISCLGIKRIVTIHGVIPLKYVNRSFVQENRVNINPLLARLGFFVLTNAIVRFTDITIVHEKLFADSIRDEYKCHSAEVAVVHIGVDRKITELKPEDAKQRLNLAGKKVLLFFGYLTGYKGIELLIDAFVLLNKEEHDYYLIIAGAEHPRMAGNADYRQYIEGLRSSARKISPDRIVFTGFVKEEDVPVYYLAADVSVFPYTVGMASSSAMAFAIAYGRPFLVSERLRGVIEFEEMIFTHKPDALKQKIQEFFSRQGLRETIENYSFRLQKERMWPDIGKQTWQVYQRLL